MIVLGISAFYHDSAAALVKDGVIIAAAQEERFTRQKHDENFPTEAVKSCLDQAGLTLEEVDWVCFYEKPLLTFNRLLETYLSYAPKGLKSFAKAMPVWVKEKVLQRGLIDKALNTLGRGKLSTDKLLFNFHHQSHAASAFFPSPFEEAAVLTIDGVGEWATTSLALGKGNSLEMLEEVRFPHSLGLLYSAFTYYLGFAVNEGEYKVMGLAPYGEPKYTDLIYNHLIQLKEDGSFKLDQTYFNYSTGLTMTNDKFAELFGAPPRRPDSPLSQRDMDIAASVQKVLEDAVLRLVQAVHEKTGQENLCMAGGVALNCVANGRILREGPFENLWVQPAAGDAGGAIGAALSAYYLQSQAERVVDPEDAMQGGYLGPKHDAAEIEAMLEKHGAVYEVLDEQVVLSRTAEALSAGKIVGWFQGRMEFGPRALGGRSILGDPRSEDMQKRMNVKIKYRESFRPFAPAVREEDVAEYFDFEGKSPYMLIVDRVKPALCHEVPDTVTGLDRLAQKRSSLPAITHVDYSARIQTVRADTNKRFYDLLTTFKDQTGCGVLVNTSFNLRDEPIVGSPEDAYRCFMGSEMDVLVLENYYLEKKAQ